MKFDKFTLTYFIIRFVRRPLKDAFILISGIDRYDINSIGIKLYGMDDNGVIIKETLVCLEQKQFTKLSCV